MMIRQIVHLESILPDDAAPPTGLVHRAALASVSEVGYNIPGVHVLLEFFLYL